MSSLREQIAQRRAAAVKQQEQSARSGQDSFIQTSEKPIDEVIKRALQSGSINLSARQLQVLPAFLFDCHLGFVPDVLKDQASSSQAENISRFGAADLTMIKLRDNAIKSIPSEISYFGALAVLDLHGNQLTSIPASLCELEDLSNLDVSSNQLTTVPRGLGGLKSLALLSLANNQITNFSESLSGRDPLPRLHTLDISGNPLSGDTSLFAALSKLSALKDLKARACDLSPNNTAGVSNDAKTFASLRKLDAEENLKLEFVHVQSILGERIAGYEGQPDKIEVLVGKRIVKEKWEIEAELRASRPKHRTGEANPPAAIEEVTRRTAALDVSAGSADAQTEDVSSTTAGSSQLLSKWYDAVHGALILPQCIPVRTRGPAATATTSTELPQLTLPVDVFYQEFSKNIRTLALSNRRVDKTLVVPDDLLSGTSLSSSAATFLPRVEELLLDGCALADRVSLRREISKDTTDIPIFDFIVGLFPALKTLDLSFGALTSAALDQPGFTALLTNGKLRTLRLQGNQLTQIAVLCDLAEKNAAPLTLAELDIRENNIDRLDARLALLPLTNLLVEGNTFRVPQRKVWEREGSAGLLKWLKERLQQLQ